MSSDRSLADEAIRRVLDRMGLAFYLFALERADDEWVVELEYPRAGAWRRVVLRASAADLCASVDDPARRDALARAFRTELARADAA